MSSFTCISCRVVFADGEVQRAHYKTDWHRYNLKRKVAEMPPVTADNFQERVLAQRAAAEEQLTTAAATQSCSTCNKRFSSANAFQNHLQSHKHLQAEKQAVQEAQRRVEQLNQRNREKGLEGEEKGLGEEAEKEKEEVVVEDRDGQNEALRRALREQQRTGPARGEEEAPGGAAGGGGGGGAAKKPRAEKPPRLVWLEEQARRGGEEEPTVPEDDWEDVDGEEDDDDMDDDDDDEEEPEEMKEEGDAAAPTSDPQPPVVVLPGSLPVTECLFCPHHSRSLLRNVAHMTREHSFFIPDLEFLVDLKGLVQYLGEKVGAGNVCLWCNEKGRSFYSTEAVQGHMTDKSHCKLFTEGDAALEFADFYDFRSSYPDQEGEDAEMKDGDLDSLLDDKNMEYDVGTLELTLPSGARIGHRSLLRYYKQRFGTQRAVVLAHNRNAVGRVMRQYQALGWQGDRGKSGFHTHARDMPYVQKMKSRWMLKMGMNHNKTKQHHFRMQVLF
ncbi:cytoplasmic 60S subunit biogenesis factor ZNF622 [Gadus macrocephalus]|uniref:cytoplasmic 60S subunit biogenesis factor ZNF622 n=1 Tax=Gadus macrocephalus TaxID=80720 RepID=UPI0028CBAF79|nr:cytoplasmic 60S subunit biogenesis factor ZNF622 [Gadus macrocephalus]